MGSLGRRFWAQFIIVDFHESCTISQLWLIREMGKEMFLDIMGTLKSNEEKAAFIKQYRR